VEPKGFLRRFILRISSVLLPASLGVFIVSLTIAVLGNFLFPRFTISSFAIVCAVFLAYSGIRLRNRLWFYFAACFLFLSGFLFLLMDIGFVLLPLPKIWPFFMLFIGISFMVSGSAYYRTLRPVYIVPSIAFAGLGFFFLLITVDLLPFSVKFLVLWWGPLLAAPGLITLIVWLFRKRSTRQSSDE
jgi:hypothetical protein